MPASMAWTNPLRDPRDKRLPRIAGPCGLVIFGVTGDLSRKKLMPAIYDLANRGLLPPGFALTGFARRDWADEDFGQVVYEAVREHARTPFRQEVWDRLAEGFRFVQGTFDDDDGVRPARARPCATWTGSAAPAATTRSTCPSRRARSRWCCKQLARSGLSAQDGDQWRRVVIEKPFGHDLQSAIELNAIVNDVFPEDSVFRIDHYLGKETVQNVLAHAVRQPAVRADLERQLRRPGADHHGRGHRPRRARRLLRRHRRRPRRDPEPPAAAARVHRDGGADLVLLRRAARREDQGAERHPAGRAAGRDHRARPVRRRLAGRRAGARAEGGGGLRPRLRAPRPTRRSPARSTPAAGPGCRSTCAPASGWAAGSPRSR